MVWHCTCDQRDCEFDPRPQCSCVKTLGKSLTFSFTDTHTHLTALFSWTTWVSRYQKGKTNLDFTKASDSEWQWHQLGHMQVCTSLQTDNHASTPPLSFLQARCPSCRPANSIKALTLSFLDAKSLHYYVELLSRVPLPLLLPGYSLARFDE